MYQNFQCNRSTLALTLITICSAITGCQQAASEQGEAPPAKVTVATPLVMNIIEWDEYIGRMDAIKFVEVRGRVGGFLKSIHFDEGQKVESGDLLCIIDPRQYETALNGAKANLKEAEALVEEAKSRQAQAVSEKNQAQARLNLAEKRRGRNRQLFQQQVVTQDELDVIESEYVEAEANLEAAEASIETAKAGVATASAAVETAKASKEEAELNLRYTRVRAPIDGRISRKFVTQGNLISGGSETATLLTTIVSLDPIHCYFDADEQAFLKYTRLSRSGERESSREVKNPVYISLVDEEGYPHKGHMDFVDNRLDPNTGTIRGRAIFPNEDDVLTPGLFAKVRIPGSGQYDAVLIPDSAIGSDQSEQFVYVVENSRDFRRQPIQTGPLIKGLRVVRDGLDGPETIVISGLQRIFPGVTLETEPGEIVAGEGDGLPDSYEPVPKEDWLGDGPEEVPAGIEQNASPFLDDMRDESESEPVKQ